MGRNKKIDAFQKAMLSNTRFIGKENQDETDAEPQETQDKKEEVIIPINSELLKKYKMLASYQNVEYKELISKALSHFLRLKSLDLEEAVKNNKAGGE